jgi:hypothetical protein
MYTHMDAASVVHLDPDRRFKAAVVEKPTSGEEAATLRPEVK